MLLLLLLKSKTPFALANKLNALDQYNEFSGALREGPRVSEGVFSLKDVRHLDQPKSELYLGTPTFHFSGA